MAAGDLIARDGQVELRGLLLGPGTAYVITGPITGVGDTEVRSAELPRPLDHGYFDDRALYGRRTLRIPIAILGDTQADTLDKLDELGAAVRLPIESIDGTFRVPLVMQLGGRKLFAFGRPGRMAVDATLLPKGATIETVVEFLATDPRLYGEERTANAVPGSVTGGLELPHDFPHGFGTATPGTIQATNDGNFPTHPVARVTAAVGGLGAFTLTKVDTGERLAVVLDVAEGEFLDLDFLNRTVLLNGQAPRDNAVQRPGSTWFALDPGTNPIDFGVTVGDATLALSWRDAFTFG